MYKCQGGQGARNTAKVMPQKGLDVTAAAPEIPSIKQLLTLLVLREFLSVPRISLHHSLRSQKPERLHPIPHANGTGG